ncbi:MAG: SEC-C metal-binding domain-containing protein [Defluviitaleaceae bacterium]|nr:SEC-C metal-binding domain-containing protein [Defluviitaleaceae bacterium]MCL2275832.1 SEC-C metal-binding domain-containing protein [Defluviitaleaceae bacterium]
MALYDAWKRVSLDPQGQPVKHVWDEYMAKEKAVYVQILKEKTTKIDLTVAEFAEKYRLTPMHVTAFIDGIHEAVDGLPHPPDEVTEETKMTFDIDFTRLYKQMVAYKAEELYSLPEWENIFTPEEQKKLYTEQKKSHTVVRNEAKIRPNDPCTCGSGKKYKKCCAGAA